MFNVYEILDDTKTLQESFDTSDEANEYAQESFNVFVDLGFNEVYAVIAFGLYASKAVDTFGGTVRLEVEDDTSD